MGAPVVAVGDGALGFWKALGDVFPSAAAAEKVSVRPRSPVPLTGLSGSRYIRQ